MWARDVLMVSRSRRLRVSYAIILVRSYTNTEFGKMEEEIEIVEDWSCWVRICAGRGRLCPCGGFEVGDVSGIVIDGRWLCKS